MTAARHAPMRSCVGCRTARPKRELVRLVLPAEPAGAAVAVDPTGRRDGRGAYLCRDTAADCLALARRKRAVARALRTTAERVDTGALIEELRTAAGPQAGRAAASLEVSSSPR